MPIRLPYPVFTAGASPSRLRPLVVVFLFWPPCPPGELFTAIADPGSLTWLLRLEGTSQRNGAILALNEMGSGLGVAHEVIDTATSPEAAVNAFLKAGRGTGVVAMVAPILGTQMLALMPLAAEAGLPLVTISGTAAITEQGNPYVFRFFPGDAVVKAAHARYVVETLAAKRPALLYQTTAYGQSGRNHLAAELAALGAPLVYEEGLSTSVKDVLPSLAKLRDAGADVLLLHLHAPTTALAVRQAAGFGLALPIVAGSAMHQPATAALLEPGELKGVCAETGTAPNASGGSDRLSRFADAYRAAFKAEPDAFAAGQYDGTMMVLSAIAAGARTKEDVRKALADRSYSGVAMTYRSDGKGNMAHDAVIVCYDGVTRVPHIVRRYENLIGIEPRG
ncbi:MAG: ABC transporter substrate-binding protein [Alphaproteobacteria bacterium]